MGRMTRAEQERFLAKINVRPTAKGCWLWEGAQCGKPDDRRPAFKLRGKVEYAYRVSAFLITGKMPKPGVPHLHACDVPLCVNPDHIRVGTQQENVHDMIKKRRSPRAKHCVTKDVVRKIRFLVLTKMATVASVAKVLDLPRRTVHDVATFKTWKSVK